MAPEIGDRADGIDKATPLQCGRRGGDVRKNEVGLQRDKFLGELLHRPRVERRPAKVDPDVAPLCPPELLETLQEHGDEALSFRPPSAYAISTPIHLTRSACCARTVVGQAAAPPSNVMNSRRLRSGITPCLRLEKFSAPIGRRPQAGAYMHRKVTRRNRAE